ncbi:MAG: 3-hydroxyacyl-CoA dehydrogenase NAD-binding domain-containing protein [Cyanobacteria bacterium P01_H01_bin.74]
MTSAHPSTVQKNPGNDPIQAIQTVAVVGAGQMGHGIAQVMACADKSVLFYDSNAEALQKGQDAIAASLQKLNRKGKISDEALEKAVARIVPVHDLAALCDADLAIEAIVELESAKTALFQSLDAFLPPKALLASNTSSISITRLAASTHRAPQVIGMHFMNPVALMQLVEIIRGAQTNDATYQCIASLTAELGKTGVMSRDFPGFISNRVLMPLINEAIFALFEGVGSAADIDAVMKLGMNHPMGPLQLADFIGLDTCLSIMTVLMDGFQDARFRPCPLLKQYVDAGYLGKKTGRGFFEY